MRGRNRCLRGGIRVDKDMKERESQSDKTEKNNEKTERKRVVISS
jgi:hypothetical protein